MGVRFIAAVVLAAATAAARDPIQVLQEEATRYHTGGVADRDSLCDSVECCTIQDSSNGCAFSDMSVNQTSLVYPGGETSCIFGDPFAFQVIPGTRTDQLLLFMQGGGACWNEASAELSLCSTEAVPSGPDGVFDKSNPANPFASYTTIQILYCSGDVHGGNVTRDYTVRGNSVTQVGLANVQSVLDWILEQQAQGNLPATFTDLVVMGCSAGSLGVQLWTPQFIEQLSWGRVGVVADSYAGVFPAGSQEELIPAYGICPWLPESLSKACDAGTINLQLIMNYNLELVSMTTQAAFTFIQSKTDIIQRSFFDAIAILGAVDDDSARDTSLISKSDFYAAVNVIFESYEPYDNFVNFMVQSSQHCYTPNSYMYTATTAGRDDSSGDGNPALLNFVGSEPLQAEQSISTECDGELLAQDDWTGFDYCDEALAGKTYTPDE